MIRPRLWPDRKARPSAGHARSAPCCGTGNMHPVPAHMSDFPEARAAKTWQPASDLVRHIRSRVREAATLAPKRACSPQGGVCRNGMDLQQRTSRHGHWRQNPSTDRKNGRVSSAVAPRQNGDDPDGVVTRLVGVPVFAITFAAQGRRHDLIARNLVRGARQSSVMGRRRQDHPPDRPEQAGQSCPKARAPARDRHPGRGRHFPDPAAHGG